MMFQKFKSHFGLSLVAMSAVLMLASCGDGSDKPDSEESTVKQEKTEDEHGLPIPADAKLLAGKTLFTSNCIDCHVDSFEAPNVLKTGPWKKRVAKGAETLYKHAIEGFEEMPARGDNPDLSDDDMKSAVDYILYVQKNI